MRRVSVSPVLLAVSACFIGCGDSNLPPMGNVSGVVSLGGSPLPDAIVTLTPVAGGRPAQGMTDSQGAFDVSTFSIGDGAIAGEHSVVINPAKSPPPSYFINPKAARGYEPPFPSRYWSKSSSGLTATVVAGKSVELNLELGSEP